MRNGAVRMFRLLLGVLFIFTLPHDTAMKRKESPTAELPLATTSIVENAANLVNPLVFEVNQGQTDSQVRFLARAKGFTLYLTRTEMVMAPENSDACQDEGFKASVRPSAQGETKILGCDTAPVETPLRLRFLDARPVEPEGSDQLPGRSNYFLARHNVPNVRQYSKVLYRGLYPGIDLVFYSDHGKLEYDYVVAPGADPSVIRLESDQPVTLTSGGAISAGTLLKESPVAYQILGADRERVSSHFVLSRPNLISFDIGEFDRTRSLVLDPRIVSSNYFGGSRGDFTNDAVADAVGNVYVVGETFSLNFPTRDPFQNKNRSPRLGDAFVTKLDRWGTIVYSTFLGGSKGDFGRAVAVDMAGSAFVVGQTASTDFPARNPSAPLSLAGFLTKLSPSGSELIYSIYLGDRTDPSAVGIRNGNAYVCGATGRFLPVVNALQPNPAGGNEAFLMKVNSSGSALLYSSYLGGRGQDGCRALSIDSSGVVYLTGWTSSPDFPITPDAFQATLGSNCGSKGCGSDTFIAKIDLEKPEILYSTYLGGTGYELPYDMDVDRFHNVYVTGRTGSPDYPLANPVVARKSFREGDTFISKLSAKGDRLIYSGYFGGGNGEAVVVDINGNAYFTGWSANCTLPVVHPITDSPGCSPSFLAKMGPGGKLLFSTYQNFGWGFALALVPGGNIYLVGNDFGIHDILVAQFTRK